MIKLAALAVFSLVPVTLVGGHAQVSRIPVLLVAADPCQCTPSVVAFAVQAVQPHCNYAGSHQPCFTGQVINNPLDQAGTCEAPAVAGEPPLPECGPRSSCLFDSRLVQIVAAPCANGACGTGPFQGLNQNGEEHGDKFTDGGEFEVKVVIGNRPCGSQPKDYDIKVMDSSQTPVGGVLVFHYRLRASCGQCSRLRP